MSLDRVINLEGKELNYNSHLQNDAEKLFNSSCKFVIGTTNYNIFPDGDLPEFAFIGRSNVGKSSLLNALVRQNKLARVSVTPGRTQQINFFSLNEKIMLVDLPGYGFAKAPVNLVKSWERMTIGYLKSRVNLKKLFLLIDARHGFKENDLKFMEQMDKFAIGYQVVLTKLDKTNQEQVTKIIDFAKSIIGNHPAMFQDMLLSSSKKNYSLTEIKTYIYSSIV